jgi:hypothetical protein
MEARGRNTRVWRFLLWLVGRALRSGSSVRSFGPLGGVGRSFLRACREGTRQIGVEIKKKNDVVGSRDPDPRSLSSEEGAPPGFSGRVKKGSKTAYPSAVPGKGTAGVFLGGLRFSRRSRSSPDFKGLFWSLGEMAGESPGSESGEGIAGFGFSFRRAKRDGRFDLANGTDETFSLPGG